MSERVVIGPFRLTVEEFLEAMEAGRRSLRRRSNLVPRTFLKDGLLGLLVGLPAGALLVSVPLVFGAVGYGIAGGALAGFLLGLGWSVMSLRITSRRDVATGLQSAIAQVEQTFTADEDGIAFSSGLGRSFVSWRGIDGFVDLSQALGVQMGMHISILPDRALPPNLSRRDVRDQLEMLHSTGNHKTTEI